jgi:hypothetical protein
MGGARLSIAGMLGIVAALALGMAALFSAASLWLSAAATLTLAIFLSAVLGAILLRGSERAFCLGFALFSGVYLVLVDWDWMGGQFGHDLTAGLSDLAEVIHPKPPDPRPSGFIYQLPVQVLQARQSRIGNFVEVGRMVVGLLFGLMGGYVGATLQRRRDRPVEDRHSSS